MPHYNSLRHQLGFIRWLPSRKLCYCTAFKLVVLLFGILRQLKMFQRSTLFLTTILIHRYIPVNSALMSLRSAADELSACRRSLLAAVYLILVYRNQSKSACTAGNLARTGCATFFPMRSGFMLISWLAPMYVVDIVIVA